MARLVIVGAGMATARLVSELVDCGADYQIEIIGEEPMPSYNRILLSSLLSGDKTEAELTLLDNDWYAEQGIRLCTGEAVTGIDRQSRTFITSTGRSGKYDKLVLATGSQPYLPPIPGSDAPGVLTFRNFQDLKEIRAAARSGSKAVIIGGGLLGLEAATGLLNLGCEVIVINREARLMPRQLDDAGARILQGALTRRGMAFRLGVIPEQIESGQRYPRAVTLSSGERLDCELLLVAAGVVPNKQLAERSGISCARGVLVDDRLATSDRNIFALGECCEMNGQLFGLVAPIYQQARVLAANLADRICRPFVYSNSSTSLKISGISVVSSGTPRDSGTTTSQTLIDKDAGVYRRLIFDDDRLTGYMLVGDRRLSSFYDSLMAGNIPVRSGRLMFDSQSGQADLTTTDLASNQ